MQASCPEGIKSPSSPPLVQCCFGLTAQACISGVTANNIAVGEGENNLLICNSKHFCEVSQQVLSEVVGPSLIRQLSSKYLLYYASRYQIYGELHETEREFLKKRTLSAYCCSGA